MVMCPGFFKLYVPSLGDENMKIPTKFLESIQGTWPMSLTLRDCYNNLWQVNVEIVLGSGYFKEGWTKFADHNMIRGGDLIIFEYSFQGFLDFKVHGPSACITKRVGALKEGEQVTKGGASTSKPQKSRDFDWYGAKIFHSGVVRQPRNDYFVTKIRQCRTRELYVPVDVIKCYSLELPGTILLIDPEGREFEASRRRWADGRTFYTGGWGTLCDTNKVGVEDTCICEFVRRGPNLCIHVSFLRSQEQNYEV